MRVLILTMILGLSLVVLGQDAKEKVPKLNKNDLKIENNTGNPDIKFEVKDVKEQSRRFIKDYDPKANFSFNGMKITDKEGHPVDLKVDRVTLIEYWSKESLKSNVLWKEARDLEKKYQDQKELFQVISINYDLATNSNENNVKMLELLKQNKMEIPEHLYFDAQDSFRDKVLVFGPVCYYLIDNRHQLIHAGRGDFGVTFDKVFDKIDNAILNLKEDGMVDYSKYEGKENEAKNE